MQSIVNTFKGTSNNDGRRNSEDIGPTDMPTTSHAEPNAAATSDSVVNTTHPVDPPKTKDFAANDLSNTQPTQTTVTPSNTVSQDTTTHPVDTAGIHAPTSTETNGITSHNVAENHDQITTSSDTTTSNSSGLKWDNTVQDPNHHVYENNNGQGRRKSSIANPNASKSGLIDPTRRRSSIMDSADRKGAIAALAASRSEKGPQVELTPDRRSSSANIDVRNSSYGLLPEGGRRKSSIMDLGRKEAIAALAASRSEKGVQQELLPDRRSSSANPDVYNTAYGLAPEGERRRSSIMQMDRKSAIMRLASSRSEKGKQAELLPDKNSSSEQPAFGALEAFDPTAVPTTGKYEAANTDPRISKSGSHFTEPVFGGTTSTGRRTSDSLGPEESRRSSGAAPDAIGHAPVQHHARENILGHPPLERIVSEA